MTADANAAAAYRSAVFYEEQPAAFDGRAFCIVTAWNPPATVQTIAENRLADRRLRARIRRLGLPAVRVTGCSPDLRHREPGWATPCTFEQAVALAAAFRQDAVFWVVGNELHLIWPDADVERLDNAAPRFGRGRKKAAS